MPNFIPKHKVQVVPSNLVLSKKAQLVLQAINPSALALIQQFAEAREEYLEFRDAQSIERISTLEIESKGLDAALAELASKKKRRRTR